LRGKWKKENGKWFRNPFSILFIPSPYSVDYPYVLEFNAKWQPPEAINSAFQELKASSST
jgi:hypothetical protein